MNEKFFNYVFEQIRARMILLGLEITKFFLLIQLRFIALQYGYAYVKIFYREFIVFFKKRRLLRELDEMEKEIREIEITIDESEKMFLKESTLLDEEEQLLHERKGLNAENLQMVQERRKNNAENKEWIVKQRKSVSEI